MDIKQKKNRSLPKETLELSPAAFVMYDVVDNKTKTKATPVKSLADAEGEMHDVITRSDFTDSGAAISSPKPTEDDYTPLYFMLGAKEHRKDSTPILGVKEHSKDSKAVSSSIELTSSDNLSVTKMRSKHYPAKKSYLYLLALILICIALFFIAFVASIANAYFQVSILKSEIAVLQKETPTGIQPSATSTKSSETLLSLIQELRNNISLLEHLSFERTEQLQKLLDVLNRTLEADLVDTDIFKQLIQIIGHNVTYPAPSCGAVLLLQPSSPSDYYWVRSSIGSAVRVYCDMIRSCGGIAGGWMRVAKLNMSQDGSMCPSDLVLGNNRIRSCVPSIFNASCSSSHFPSNNIAYSRVCGMVRGYGYGSLDGFDSYSDARPSNTSLDSNYVDGISLTHRWSQYRQHIWTFTARYSCPCSNKPSFVANDYFCDSCYGRCNKFLWDGYNCNNASTPWFYKQLPQPATDNIEMRVCRDQPRGDEDIAIEVIELYVQ